LAAELKGKQPMSAVEPESEPIHIPTRADDVVSRLNIKLLPQQQRVLFDGLSGGYVLVDLNKAKKLPIAQLRLLAREHKAIDDCEVIII
jgi:hypothetical protein